jgi:periplasmic nitrate reductase NapE
MRDVMTQDEGAVVETGRARARRTELLAFAILAFGIWPVVAVGVVGGYGFLVWMWQIVFGPPGPPAG